MSRSPRGRNDRGYRDRESEPPSITDPVVADIRQTIALLLTEHRELEKQRTATEEETEFWKVIVSDLVAERQALNSEAQSCRELHESNKTVLAQHHHTNNALRSELHALEAELQASKLVLMELDEIVAETKTKKTRT